ncbi:AraC family transcriptional regulator [Clostridium tagluense]|uniref:helix-turn-helix transcriptional regulator n=1 Tax=Clostridium tagluense TaxID=360422 RepID=UPI001C0DBF87|nr:AraC family transcriptional regulator [Clostridium tagluense]MBU3128779.1 AraC family transcriptional regulator [Clostridium tagluense]MCB2313393.1 AraC family transcriptional regulator [Clostridium tagluense]MCB2318253.1 AraC family transcriptional regulator [Clostridium tagluense]MCB2323055.1 AraC family transcriptional regulator [Clostridium tagluense]MCB2328001.1 AraC family transcriptional regulator [Clostridium tagluense]
MRNLLNHTELTLNIRNNNLENANSLYIKKTNVILSFSNNPNELKKLLYSMSIFIYTYFCINSSIPLEDLCSKNLKSIDNCHSKDDLITLGKEIIKSYMDVINNKSISENEIVKHALTYIHSNIEKKITLEKVAAHIHISSNYLCCLFKENTGFKFCEYINICRINTAKDFLDNSSNALDIISFKCGFNSQSHFSTTFKKYEGVSPNEYKKRAK